MKLKFFSVALLGIPVAFGQSAATSSQEIQELLNKALALVENGSDTEARRLIESASGCAVVHDARTAPAWPEDRLKAGLQQAVRFLDSGKLYYAGLLTRGIAGCRSRNLDLALKREQAAITGEHARIYRVDWCADAYDCLDKYDCEYYQCQVEFDEHTEGCYDGDFFCDEGWLYYMERWLEHCQTGAWLTPDSPSLPAMLLLSQPTSTVG